MKIIRSLRLKKRGSSYKRRYTMISIQLIAIIYLLFFTAFQMTSPTTAYFSDTEKMVGTISAADQFPGQGKHKIKRVSEGGDCNEIYGKFKNWGQGDAQSLKYEVLFEDQGQGRVVDRGTVSIAAGETATITYEPVNDNNKNGKYRFKVYKEPGNNGQGVVQSQQIKENCEEIKSKPSKDAEAESDKKHQESVKKDNSKDSNQNNNNKTDEGKNNTDSANTKKHQEINNVENNKPKTSNEDPTENPTENRADDKSDKTDETSSKIDGTKNNDQGESDTHGKTTEDTNTNQTEASNDSKSTAANAENKTINK